MGINNQIIILNIKQIKKMKKVILALAVVSFAFAACNNDGETKEAAKTDSPAVVAPDTTKAPVAAPVVDTMKKAIDTVKKK